MKSRQLKKECEKSHSTKIKSYIQNLAILILGSKNSLFNVKLTIDNKIILTRRKIMTHQIDNYINYKNKNVAIYTKKEFENQNIYENVVGKVSWMHIELEDFGVNIIEFIDSHEEGSYKEINRLIKSVNQGEIQAVLVWDFNEISLEIGISLIEECDKRNVYIDGFLTSLEIKDNN